jgi:hypothetical protein
VDEMIPSLTVVAAVTGIGNHRKFRPGKFDPNGKGQRTAMEAVEIINIQVLGHFGRLSDPRCEDNIFSGKRKFLKGLFQDIPDSKIAASRAPCDIRSLCHISSPHISKGFTI